jgi:hypothetical protein
MMRLLRLVAVAIAIAAALDPAITMSGSTRARLAIVTADPALPEAVRVRDAVVRMFEGSHEIVPHLLPDVAAAVVIGDRYPDEPVPENVPVATVSVGPGTAPAVRLLAVEAPREVPPGTTIPLELVAEGVGVAGASSDFTAHIAGLEVARVSHRWASDREQWRARIDAVPVGDPPWVVRVSTVRLKPDTTADSVTDDATADSVTDVVSGFSRTVDALVDVRRRPLRVAFYEPRPSWATTFVRRALESDARFDVSGVSFSSRGIAARTGDAAALADPRIDGADTVVVGGLDHVSATDVRALDRFMRERGGAVVLVPDALAAAAAVRDLFPWRITERLLERPASLTSAAGVPALQASELLVFGGPPPGADKIATIPGADPSLVVASAPHGRGRVFVSGAMDAWRFRASGDDAFERFWRSAIGALALAAPPPVDVAIDPPLLRPLQRGDVVVRVRSGEYAPITAAIDGQPIRLHPQPEAGVFRGTFIAKGAPGRQTIAIRGPGAAQTAISRIALVQSGARGGAAAPPLSMLATSHGGVDVTPNRLGDLERYISRVAVSPRARSRRHPMRSAWWLVPFAGCLSVEWWLRRRRGLR